MQFIEQASKHYPTIKFTAEISETEATFLDTNIYIGERSRSNLVLSIYALLFVSPTRGEKRFHQRRSSETSQNKLLKKKNI